MGGTAYTADVSDIRGAFTSCGLVRIIAPAMPRNPPDPERIAIPMPAELIQRIDEFRWRNRIPSRAEAIRQLIEIGLANAPPSRA